MALGTYRSKVKVTCVRTGKTKKIQRYKIDASQQGTSNAAKRPCVLSNLNRNIQDQPDIIATNLDEQPLNVTAFRSEGNSYYQKKQKDVLKWKELRKALENAFIETSCMPSDALCSLCHEKPTCEEGARRAETRCLDCGIDIFMCVDCCLESHKKRNKLHYLEKWQDGTFVPLERPAILIELVELNHMQPGCARSKRIVKVVDSQGRQFECLMETCACKPDGYFFIKQRFWPATPAFPRMAFTFQFMDLLKSLFIESQTSVSSFCASISNLTPPFLKLLNDGRDLLKALQGESFEEYRLFKHNISTLRSLCKDRDEGTSCPACPAKNASGYIIESIDACFGLVHKKVAGKYDFQSKFGALKIKDSEEVDEFMESYPTCRATTKDCNNFQAGAVGSKDTIYSKGKSSLYDIKGLLGTICRHEFPQQFLDLKHGERIGYSVFLIKKKIEELASNPDVTYCVLYDIACILRKHLQKHDSSLLEQIIVGLPAFHSYAHIPSCQAILGTRRVQNIGLSDGEQCERLWSYLRCFSSITKEMTKAHRKDALTTALLHYGKKSVGKLCITLPKKMEKAVKIADTCRKQLQTLLSNAAVNGNIAVIQEWIAEERQALSNNHPGHKKREDSKYVVYVRALLANRQLRQKLMIEDTTQDETDIAASVQLLRRSEKDLARIEKECGIKKRWTWTVDSAKSIAVDLVLEERRETMEVLRTLAHERKFLLKMKRLYADGQKLAKTLATSIGKKNRRISDILGPFNRKVKYLSREIKELRGKEIDLEKAKDSASDLYSLLLHEENTSVPGDIKQEAIDLYCRLARAEEEKVLLKSEMANTINFYKEEQKKVLLSSAMHHGDSLWERGAVALLNKEFKILTETISRLVTTFSQDVPDCIASDEIPTDSLYHDSSDDDDMEDAVMDQNTMDIDSENENELDFFDY